MSTDLAPDDFAPGKLLDYGGGHYGLVYLDFPDFRELFARRGVPAGGTTWESMVEHLLEEHEPIALEALEFECEPDSFLARSDNLDALRSVARMLRKLESKSTVVNILDDVNLTEYE